jgi:hypothetical protein
MMQRQERKRGPFAQQRLVRRLARRAKSPHSGAINAKRSTEGLNPKTGWWSWLGSNWRPTTQSSNRSPRKRGTEFYDAETGAQTRPFCPAEISPETGEACEKPPFWVINAKRSTENPRTGWWR